MRLSEKLAWAFRVAAEPVPSLSSVSLLTTFMPLPAASGNSLEQHRIPMASAFARNTRVSDHHHVRGPEVRLPACIRVFWRPTCCPLASEALGRGAIKIKPCSSQARQNLHFLTENQ